MLHVQLYVYICSLPANRDLQSDLAQANTIEKMEKVCEQLRTRLEDIMRERLHDTPLSLTMPSSGHLKKLPQTHGAEPAYCTEESRSCNQHSSIDTSKTDDSEDAAETEEDVGMIIVTQNLKSQGEEDQHWPTVKNRKVTGSESQQEEVESSNQRIVQVSQEKVHPSNYILPIWLCHARPRNRYQE